MKKKAKKISWMGDLKSLGSPLKNGKDQSLESSLKKKKPKLERKQKARRKALEATYRLAYESIPDNPQCAACGLPSAKDSQDRHHPAGRRKDAFLFTCQLCNECHRRVHDHPKLATLQNLLWKGRNSKVLSMADAVKLVEGMPFPPTYAIEILKKYKP